MTNSSDLKTQYQGSVKNVFTSKNEPDSLWFSFTDQYSVFDWGKMPDLIANKGCALALMGSYIFQTLGDKKIWLELPQSSHLKKFNPEYLSERFNHPTFKNLQKTGLPSHFLELYQQTNGKLEEISLANKITLANQTELLMKVLGAKVNWPVQKSILHESLYFYPQPSITDKKRLIPLEVVFRFGMVEGSSLKRKLENNPGYTATLGLQSVPAMNKWFPQPVLEFFTKLEAKDRLLSWQEAAGLANLTAEQFEELVELSLDIALALHAFFAEHKLELWDGKLEFILDNGQLRLADSVGPDELRLLHNGVHLSKEMLRQYYRHTTWAKSLSDAQNIARENGTEDWQEICRKQLKQSPEKLAPEMKNIADQLYSVLTNQIFTYPVFPNHPSLDDYISSLKNTLSKFTKEQVSA